MKFDVYAKHIVGKNPTTNKSYDFYNYTTRLVRKDGEVVTATVKFSNIDPPDGASCPTSIIVPKKKMNMAIDHYEKRDPDTGDVVEVATKYILWVKEYTITEFVDHSMDDFITDDDE